MIYMIERFEKFNESNKNKSLRERILDTLEENGGTMKNNDLYSKLKSEIDDIFDFYSTLSKLNTDGKIKENKQRDSIILVK